MKTSENETQIRPKNKPDFEIKGEKENLEINKKTTNRTKTKYVMSAWSVFTTLLLAVAIYQYFTFNKTLHAPSLTFLVAFVYALHKILNAKNKIEQYNENSFLIRILHANKLLLKAKRVVRWFDTIKTWQRIIIFFSFFMIGYLGLIM